MKVALTGATGFIGSHVLADLHKHGHEVTALVRNDAQADTVAARGAIPAVADLYDRPAVTKLLGRADGAIHTASPGDATSANLDAAVVDVVDVVDAADEGVDPPDPPPVDEPAPVPPSPRAAPRAASSRASAMGLPILTRSN